MVIFTNIINLYDNILINKYQGLITCNRLTPLHLGYVVRFKALVVARGDKQRPGFDFKDTFSPVARMATFRMFIAVCIIRDIVIYKGDIKSAYLNPTVGKKHLEEVEGYTCEDKAMIYINDKALYGLRQSGRE